MDLDEEFSCLLLSSILHFFQQYQSCIYTRKKSLHLRVNVDGLCEPAEDDSGESSDEDEVEAVLNLSVLWMKALPANSATCRRISSNLTQRLLTGLWYFRRRVRSSSMSEA